MTQPSSKFDAFAALHVRGRPLVLYNVWDAGSAQAVARAGAPAIATGSWSVAAAHGFGDGEHVPFDLVVANAARIAAATDLPTTIDLEGGYGARPDEVGASARAIAQAGCIGCNFEDRIVQGEGLHTVEAQAARIAGLRAAAGLAFFINARTDIFLQAPVETHAPAMVEAALVRAAAYAAAGANGFFAPGLIDLTLIEALAKQCPLPLNIMASPKTPPAPDLARVGVARISHGPGPYRRMIAELEAAARGVYA